VCDTVLHSTAVISHQQLLRNLSMSSRCSVAYLSICRFSIFCSLPVSSRCSFTIFGNPHNACRGVRMSSSSTLCTSPSHCNLVFRIMTSSVSVPALRHICPISSWFQELTVSLKMFSVLHRVKVGRINLPPRGVTCRRCGLSWKFFEHLL